MSRPQLNPADCVKIVTCLHILAFPDSHTHCADLSAAIPSPVLATNEDLVAWVTEPGSVAAKKLSDHFPLASNPPIEALAVNNETALYAGYASVIFAIARQASDRGAVAATDNRPKALIARFSIPEPDQAILPGRAYGPSASALEQVYNAFANLPEPRNRICTYLLGLKYRGGYFSTAEEVVLTNFRLMEGAGMTHVTAVMDLCRMHPWVLKVPELQPYFVKFADDLVKFSGVPESVRRYHRLLVPQSEYLFLSSDLKPLIAVAGSFITEVEKNFGGYVYNGPDHQQLIDKVHSHRPAAANASALTGLAAAMNLPDVPLPEATNNRASSTRIMQ